MRFMLFALLASCAVDELDSTEQDVSTFGSVTTSSTMTLSGVQTNWSTQTSDCVLSAVAGTLWQGVAADGFASEALVKFVHIGIFVEPGFLMYAHGGKTPSGWTNNLVRGDVACVPYPQTFSATWPGAPVNGVSPPVRIAGLAANRRCFLAGVIGGDNAFAVSTDSVSVRQITAIDATHPTTGWYLEGTLHSTPSTPKGGATATCIDFPTIAAEWGGAFGGATYTMTSGTGVKMCGLTGVYGVFTTTNEGAILNAPQTQTGNWTMTVGAGKYAEADCIQ